MIGIGVARQQRQRHEACAAGGHRRDLPPAHRCALPNSPAGLTSSTPRNNAKFTASVSPGSTKVATSDSLKPSARPATRQPSRLPTPPITTTISAFMVKMTPDDALKVRNMLIKTPAAATSAPPSANANADVLTT